MPPFLMSLLGAAGSAANGGQQMIRSAVSRVVGLMANTFISGIRLMFNSIVGVFRAGANAVSNLATSLFKGTFGLMKAGLVGLAAVVGGTVVALKQAVDTVRRLGNELNSLRATGFGMGSAAAIQRNFRAYGLNPDFGGLTPDALNARAGAWGLPGVSDRNFIPALAAQYKNSDPYMRDYLLSNFNMNNDETRRMMMMSQSDLRGQASFQNRVHSQLGVSPEVVSGLSQRTELLTQRMTILKDAVFMKLAEVALPRLLAVGERVVSIIGDNAGQIGTLIDTAFEKVNSTIINVATILLKIPDAMFALADSVLAFTETAIKAIPMVWDLFLRGVAFVQDALGNLIGLAQNGFSHLTGLAQMMGSAFVGAGETVMQVWQVIEGPMQSVFDGIIDFLERLGRAAPALETILSTVGKVPGVIEGGAKKAGMSNEWSAVLGLAGLPLLYAGAKKVPGLVAKGALGLFGRGAATAAAGAAGAAGVGGTTGGILSLLGGSLATAGAGAIAGATAIGAGIGTGVGYLGYSNLQNLGLIDPTQSFTDRMSTGWGRFRDFVTLNPGHYDRMWNQQWAKDHAAQASSGKKRPMPGFGFHLPRLGAVPGMVAGMAGSINTNPMQSSWAMGLDERFGDQVRGFSTNALSQVGELRKNLDGMRGKYDSEAMIAELRKINGKLDEQTKYAKETAQGISGVGDRAAGYAMWRYAKESGMALRAQGR